MEYSILVSMEYSNVISAVFDSFRSIHRGIVALNKYDVIDYDIKFIMHKEKIDVYECFNLWCGVM